MKIKKLKNDLELRIEPSFRFDYTDTVSKDRMRIESSFGKIKEEKGLDLSLYSDGKLCLSDGYNFNGPLGEFEDQVDRKAGREKTVTGIFAPIVNYLSEQRPESDKRTYEVLDVDVSSYPFDLKNNEFFRITDRVCTDDILYFISKEKAEPEIVDECWAREYPIMKPMIDGGTNQIVPDRSLGNSFSVYFFNPQYFEYDRQFQQAAYKSNLNWHDNSALAELAEATIMSLDFGHRMRAIGFDEEILEEAVEKTRSY